MKFLLFLLLLAPTLLYAQTSTVKGVVTYFFNDNQGDKPDIGAKVYLIDSANASFINLKMIDSFQNGQTYLHLYSSYNKMYMDYTQLALPYQKKKKYLEQFEEYSKTALEHKANADRFMDSLTKYNSDIESVRLERDKKISPMLMRVGEENSNQSTVDGSGNYSFTTRPGPYIVYIKSKNRTGHSILETSGQVYIRRVSLKDGEIKDVSHNFTLY